MDSSQHSQQEAGVPMTPELQEEIRLARRCFTNIERLSTLMAGYPPGHPVVEKAIDGVREAFYEYFEVNDRLTVQVHPHWMVLYGTDKVVWETDDPKDYCFALTRDGIYLLHILAGIDIVELRRLVEILNELVDQRDLSKAAVELLFEASFRYLSYDAIDESLAALAGLDNDMRDRDTREEQEMIEELFNDAFDKGLNEQVSASKERAEPDFEVRLSRQSERHQKLEVGSRQFLELTEEAQTHLLELKRGFTDHAQREHRQGEVLSAILGARPKENLRRQAVTQIGEVMGALLGTMHPWETLSFLKIIHSWRDKFGPEVADELKEVVKSCFNERRIQLLVKNISISDQSSRRAILQMFNALHLDVASPALVELLGWEIADDVREDLLRYVRERSRYGLDFLEGPLLKLSAKHAEPLVELVVANMPRTRHMLVNIVRSPTEPALKVKALKALHSSWKDPQEVREVLVPLLDASNSEVRIAALQSFVEAAPQHVFRVLEPMFTDKLRSRPEEEVRLLVNVFVTQGKQEAVDKLRGLVHRRGLVNDDEQELAVTIARALMRTPLPVVITMLEAVGKDWLVLGRLRATCKEVAELLQAGQGR
ncbi:MAG: hypothetical protein H0U74_04235 [Bradymonadaceae bacterium]|nr:hypothetical protein [Lujinxingiaceae bacterium]